MTVFPECGMVKIQGRGLTKVCSWRSLITLSYVIKQYTTASQLLLQCSRVCPKESYKIAIPMKYVNPELSVPVKNQRSEYLNDIGRCHAVLIVSLVDQYLLKQALLGLEILASRLAASWRHSSHYREH